MAICVNTRAEDANTGLRNVLGDLLTGVNNAEHEEIQPLVLDSLVQMRREMEILAANTYRRVHEINAEDHVARMQEWQDRFGFYQENGAQLPAPEEMNADPDAKRVKTEIQDGETIGDGTQADTGDSMEIDQQSLGGNLEPAEEEYNRLEQELEMEMLSSGAETPDIASGDMKANAISALAELEKQED